MQVHVPAAVVDEVRVEQVDEAPLRQPGADAAHEGGGAVWGGDGRDEQVRAKVVLRGDRVCLAVLVVPVHGLDERLVLVRGADVHGVEVGDQAVAQQEEVLDDLGRALFKVPGLLGVPEVLGGVQPQDRGEAAELHPADRELVGPHAAPVAADVVAPPAVADVGGRRRELGLELEPLPGDLRVAREADRVPVRPRAGVPRKGQRLLQHLETALAGQVVVVVEHPQRVDAGDLGPVALLPVDPPKVDALLLEVELEDVKVGVEEPPVGAVKPDRLFPRRVVVQGLGHLLILVLKGPDAVGRVVVQCHLQATFVQLLHETIRVGEEVAVPAVSGPAGAVLARDVGLVPVHVDHANVERDALLLEVVQELDILVGGVLMVPRPPVAQGPAGKDRLTARELIEGLDGSLVVPVKGKEVAVDAVRAADGDPPVIEQHGLAVVENGVGLAREHARLQVDAAPGAVEGPGGAAQVSVALAIVPPDIAADLDREPVGREGLLVVGEVQMLRLDLEAVLGLDHAVVRHVKPSEQRKGGDAVLKLAVGGPLEAEQPVSQDAEAIVRAAFAARDDGLGIGCRLAWERVPAAGHCRGVRVSE